MATLYSVNSSQENERHFNSYHRETPSVSDFSKPADYPDDFALPREHERSTKLFDTVKGAFLLHLLNGKRVGKTIEEKKKSFEYFALSEEISRHAVAACRYQRRIWTYIESEEFIQDLEKLDDPEYIYNLATASKDKPVYETSLPMVTTMVQNYWLGHVIHTPLKLRNRQLSKEKDLDNLRVICKKIINHIHKKEEYKSRVAGIAELDQLIHILGYKKRLIPVTVTELQPHQNYPQMMQSPDITEEDRDADENLTDEDVDMAESIGEAMADSTREIIEDNEVPNMSAAMDDAEDVIDLTHDYQFYETNFSKDNQPSRFKAVSSAEEPLPKFLPLPEAPNQKSHFSWKAIPPKPVTEVYKNRSKINIKWFMENFNPDLHATIISYQIYVCEETKFAPKVIGGWMHDNDVKAEPLPMNAEKKHLEGSPKQYIVVRAKDCYNRFSDFSEPRTW